MWIHAYGKKAKLNRYKKQHFQVDLKQGALKYRNYYNKWIYIQILIE